MSTPEAEPTDGGRMVSSESVMTGKNSASQLPCGMVSIPCSRATYSALLATKVTTGKM